MFWAILVSLIVLGIAYLIQKAEPIIEVRNAMYIIAGVFLVLYIAAAIFVSYRVKAWSAEKIKAPGNSQVDSTYIYEETVNPTDLSTSP